MHNLLGMNREVMECLFQSIGEQKFRARQVMQWIYHEGVTDFSAMTNLSKQLQNKLLNIAYVSPLKIVNEYHAIDGVKKWIVRVASGSLVEMVYIPEKNRRTLCVSSQAGCKLNCSFCVTGKQGFNSDLSVAEIVGQVWHAVHQNKSVYHHPITNVVFMGMGEPLLNFDNVMMAVDIILDDLGFGLSKRRVTVSTSGVVPAIYRMIGRTEVALAVSLHAPMDELRNTLVPLNKKYPLDLLLPAAKEYITSLAGKKRTITIEYTLIKDVNDQAEHITQLIHILQKLPCKINLIPFNTFAGTNYQMPNEKVINYFHRCLQNAGFNATIRKTRGHDIAAACGQLAGSITDRTKRSIRIAN